MIDIEILKQEPLTDMINDFKVGDLRLLSSGLLPVESGPGNSFSWDIEKLERDIDTFEGDFSPAGTRKLQIIGNRSAKLVHSFKSTPVPGFVLMDLRNPGSESRQKIAEDQVGRELLALNRLLDRQNEYMISRALQGSLAMTIDGLVHTVDYGFSGSHILGIGTGIPVSWEDPAANIVKDIETMKVLISEDSGFTPTRVLTSTETIRRLIQNEFVQSYFASTQAGVQALTEGTIGRFMGLEWITYDNTYKPVGGSATRYIPSNKLIMLPSSDREWGFWRVGSDVIPTDDKRNIQEVVGRYAYSEILSNPASLALYAGERRLPIIRKPDAVVVATIAA